MTKILTYTRNRSSKFSRFQSKTTMLIKQIWHLRMDKWEEPRGNQEVLGGIYLKKEEMVPKI